MAKDLTFGEFDFGECEAELDYRAIASAFYDSDGWAEVNGQMRLPFVVGRKGAGKSAIGVKLELDAQKKAKPFIRLVPKDFRHVELREMLKCLISTTTSWQYIYHRVWEGIILGQIVGFLVSVDSKDLKYRLEKGGVYSVQAFADACGSYVKAADAALIEVIAQHIKGHAQSRDAVQLMELRKLLEPWNWKTLVSELDGAGRSGLLPQITVCIDGLDEHWDSSDASLYFLAQGLDVVKSLSGRLQHAVRFVVCVRDSIFRKLVDTKCVEYDKLESSIVSLEWNGRSLFELISIRAFPYFGTIADAVEALREKLPGAIDGLGVDEYLGLHILNRPRDYINVFRLLQAKCGNAVQASESNVRDVVRQYCGNRLIDLENEFGHTYPGITKVISYLGGLPGVFDKQQLLARLKQGCDDATLRNSAPELMTVYGEPKRLAMILISLGVVGFYHDEDKVIRCVQEFSETRVADLYEQGGMLGMHPVYRHIVSDVGQDVTSTENAESHVPAIADPTEYLPEKGHPEDLPAIQHVTERMRSDLCFEIESIYPGQQHFSRFEKWVEKAVSACFLGDLAEPEAQIVAKVAQKRFEIMFDIVGSGVPWDEMKGKYQTHRLLVECKNTDVPTDADVSKLERDMEALDTRIGWLVYRGHKREPSGDVVTYARSRYHNSGKKHIILLVTDIFLKQCLGKKTVLKCRENLNHLWKLHLTMLFPV